MRALTKVAQVQIPEGTPYVRGLGLLFVPPMEFRFSSPENRHFHSNRTWEMVERSQSVDSLRLLIYLFIYLFIYLLFVYLFKYLFIYAYLKLCCRELIFQTIA